MRADGGKLNEGGFCLTGEFYDRHNCSHIELWLAMLTEAYIFVTHLFVQEHTVITVCSGSMY